MANKVLSLGHCAADNYAITHLLESNFGAKVLAVDTIAEALIRLRGERVGGVEGGTDRAVDRSAMANAWRNVEDGWPTARDAGGVFPRGKAGARKCRDAQ